MIVVDTNVVSELLKPSPHPSARTWIMSHIGELYTTSVTLAEVGYGIERLPAGRRKDQLRTDASDAFAMFANQVLSFDPAAALKYASIVVGRDRAGRPIEGFDAQIASICRVHGATLATRNLKDFQGVGIDLLDPWREA